MKKFIMVLMAVLFLGATTGVVMAQGTTTSKPASTSKSSKGKKSHTKKPKSKGSSSAPASAK